MGFGSIDELVSAASEIAVSWGDSQAGIEHAAVAVLDRAAMVEAGRGNIVRTAAVITASREGSVGGVRFANPGNARIPISKELQRSVATLDGRIPMGSSEWLAWIERTLEASPRPSVRRAAVEVSALQVEPVPPHISAPSSLPIAFTEDLTEQAHRGVLNAVFNRDAELERVVRVLGRRTKNHPVLIGPPGIGKTAIVELLATRIAERASPSWLHGARILQVHIGEMLAGTRYRGDLEDRYGRLVRAVAGQPGLVILFFDEVHLLVGAGLSEGSPVDLGNLIKPALARSSIRVIGATTEEEYQHHIRRDPALERRLHPIRILEPGVVDTIRILDGLRPHLERHHGVTIPPPMVRNAALMSSMLMVERHQPDKAIDLLDEACSYQRLRASGDRGVLSIDDLRKVADDWQDGGGTHIAVGRDPFTRIDVLCRLILAALSECALLRSASPALIQVTGLADMGPIFQVLRNELAELATVQTFAHGDPLENAVEPEVALVVLTATSADAESFVRSVGKPKAGSLSFRPCVVLLVGGGETELTDAKDLQMALLPQPDLSPEVSIERLIAILGGWATRVRIKPAALRAIVAKIESLDEPGSDSALRSVHRQISHAVVNELTRVRAGHDIVLDITTEADIEVFAYQDVRRRETS